MATTFPRIPSFLSIPYHDKVYFYNRQRYHHWYQNSSRRCFTVYFASSVKTPRVRKKVKSNEELRSEIMEFVSVYGFPEGHVPSMKDLSEKGRIDLANIVRRRGYKFITELLSSSNIADADELFPEKIIDEEQNANGVCAENTLSGQNKGADTLEEEFSSTEVSSTENSFPTSHEYLKSDSNSCKGEDTRNTLINETNEVKSNISHISSGEEDVGIFSSLNQDVDDLVKDTSLLTNDFEFENYTSPELKFRSHTETPEESSSTSTGLATSDAINDQDHQINDMAANLSECPDDSWSLESDNENTMQVGNVTSNGSLIASKEHSHVTPATIQRDDNLRTGSFDFGRASHPETVTENQVEINHLKLLLHQKELELSRLKDQIEKEKLALSLLQEKAEIEIKKAQKLISEKDAELLEAEESLSGLKEVEIEYCGDGHVVEVIGSFNGWQHRIEMDPQPSTESRKQRCWSTLLWLYPGTYEVKFIVDGQWRTDPKKESVTKGHITNNILKVDG